MLMSTRNTGPTCDAGALVTVGITAFNAVDSIDRAIDSALRQTHQNIEIVVVDDCSSDGTLDLLVRRALVNRKLRILPSSTNAGVAVARNKIISEARGEFLVFFDDDDISEPSRIEEQLQRIVQYEASFGGGAPVICHTARTVVHADGQSYIAPTMGEREGRAAPSGINVAKRILMGTPLEDGYGAIPTCSQMARTATYRLIGGFDVELRRSEDTEFSVRLSLRGGHFVGIAKPLVIQHMTRTSEKSLSEELRNMLLVMQKHHDFLKRYGEYEFCVCWLKAKHVLLEGNKPKFLFSMAAIAFRWPLLTLQRLLPARRNLSLNRAFSRFHR